MVAGLTSLSKSRLTSGSLASFLGLFPSVLLMPGLITHANSYLSLGETKGDKE